MPITLRHVLGKAGGTIPLVCGERTFKLSPLTKAVQSQFESWLEQLALEAAARLKPKLSDDQHQALLNDIADKSAEGHYSFWGPIAQARIKTLDGLIHLLHLLLLVSQPKTTLSEVEDLFCDHEAEMKNGLDRALGKEDGPDQPAIKGPQPLPASRTEN